ncbi:hypothetical protein VSQ32_09945 [Lachnospiraceae bacterium KK002]
MRDKIETFIKRMDLNPEIELICDVFKFIDECDANKIVGVEERMAALFCRSVSFLPQDNIPEDVKKLLIKAFLNIQTMANQRKGTSELRTIYLLNQLYQSNLRTDYDEIIQEEFELLLDNLEKIRILFKIVDDNENEYFPISSLLFNLINCDNLVRDITEVKTIQALMLALQIFDKSKYPQQFEDIQNIVVDKNLKFVEYLYAGAIRLGGEEWRRNYEKNGTLVLYDTKNSSILVRNINREYFEIDTNMQNYYNFSEIYEEKNEEEASVAYYVEYQKSNLKTINMKNEFSAIDNRKRILQILKLIYEDKYYNILLEDSLFTDSESVRPINPFAKYDKYTIIDDSSVSDGLVEISKWLKKFGLISLAGKGIQIVNLGTLISLEEIYTVKLDLLGIYEEKIKFGGLLANWIRNCPNKREAFNKFLKEYTERLKYIYDKKDLFNKNFEDDFFMPYSIEAELISELDFEEIISMLPANTFNIEKDFIEESINISQVGTGKDFSNYEIKSIDGEEIYDVVGELCASVDEDNHILYIGTEVEYYVKLNKKISELNSKVLDEGVINSMDEFNVSQIEKMMDCFQTAFERIHPGIPIIDIARYRLAHHLLLLRLEKDKVIPWIKLLNCHEIVEYSFVDSLPYNGEQGILYVPKDRSRSQSTYKHIYQTYILNPLKRDLVDIYDQKITLKEDGYYVGSEKITKVVFLFDIIQNGSATKNTLDYYLNKNSVEDNTHIVFYCNDKKVSVADIIEKNNECEIEVYTIYSGESGRKKVQEHLNKKLENRKCKVLEPLRNLSHVLSKEDDELRKIIYKGRFEGLMNQGDYMVIREYNQPKHNIMSNNLMKLERVSALFCKRAENY